MKKLKLGRDLQEKVLKEVQHGDITTLQNVKSQNIDFHWSSICYEKTGDTALHIASRLGYLSVVDYLLKEYEPCAVNIKNRDDKTALHEAAQFTQPDCVEKLCSYGADVNVLRRGDWTPLMLACTKVFPGVNLKIANILVENGAQINICNKDGWTCAHILAREGGADIFDFLVSHRMEINKKTKNGRAALHIATLHGNTKILKRLLSSVDVNAKDGCGNTPLHEAILGQHVDIARWLIKQGANIYSRNNADLSILHLAASQEKTDVINYVLKELNYDINDQNKNGWTAAHCAARLGLKEIFEYLKTAGIDLEIKDNFGRTAMDYFHL